MIPVFATLAERFPEVVWEDSHGQQVARVPNEQWYEFAGAVKEAGFNLFSDVTAVDWYRSRRDRFDVAPRGIERAVSGVTVFNASIRLLASDPALRPGMSVLASSPFRR